MHTSLSKVVDFHVDDAVRQSKLRDTVFQYAANLMQGLKDIHFESLLHHVACEAQARRSGTHYGDLDAVRGFDMWQRYLSALTLVVGSEALQVSDGHSRLVHLQVDASAFALFLLWADTSTHCGQR